MSAIGERDEIINATQVFLKLNSDTHILLQDLSLVVERFETREDVATGAIYFYSQHHNDFEATIFLSGPEVATYLTKNQLITDFLFPQSYAIEYVPLTGDPKTVTVTAMTPHVGFQKTADGGVRTTMRFRINEDVDGGNVT